MKKTMLAGLLATAFGMSTSAMAVSFTDGDFTGGVDIGGDITVPVYGNYWQWGAGDDLTFTNTTSQLTNGDINGGKTLTLPASANMPLLVGQTKQATWGNPSSVTPQIAFQDAAGNTITPVWVTTGNTGKGTMTLPVTAADGTTALGTMTMNVQAGGYQAVYITSTGSAIQHNIFGTTTPGNLFGTTALPTAEAGILVDADNSLAWIDSLGATKTSTDFLNDLGAIAGKTFDSWSSSSNYQATHWATTPTTAYLGAYGLGIAQGDTIVVNFTNAVTTATTWKAPLHVSVTYM